METARGAQPPRTGPGVAVEGGFAQPVSTPEPSCALGLAVLREGNLGHWGDHTQMVLTHHQGNGCAQFCLSHFNRTTVIL